MKVSCIVLYRLYFINYAFSNEFSALKVSSCLLKQQGIEKNSLSKRGCCNVISKLLSLIYIPRFFYQVFANELYQNKQYLLCNCVH